MTEQIEILGEALAVELSSEEIQHVAGGAINIETRINSCSDPFNGGAVVCDSKIDNARVE